MSANNRHRCVVCGRIFPRGQGIVINKEGVVLEFHSSKCASKFFSMLLERIPFEEVSPYIKKLINEFNELNEQKARARAKKI